MLGSPHGLRRLTLALAFCGGIAFPVSAELVPAPGYMSGYTPQPSPICGPNGCSWNGTGTPAITGTCESAGTGETVTGNNFSGRLTCSATANTTATLTWANARTNQPVCIVVGETVAVTTIGTNSTTALSITYASTVSPIFDYICIGQ